MLEGMDEFYSLNLSRESLKGMAENARQGYWNGGYAPYGYKFTFIQTPKGQKRKLMIEDSEAKAVRLIFKMYLNGLGASKIRNELNALGFKTRSNHLFNRNIILGILRNDKYMGDITFGKHLNKKKRPIEVRMDAITIKDVHEPLVSREEFAKIQTLLDSYRPTENNPRSVASEFLFTSLIECSVCGSHFVGKSCINRQGNRYRYYLCSALDRMGAKGCTQRKFNADDLEPLLVEKLRDHLTRREIIKEIVEKYNRDLAKTKGTATKDISRIEREIVSLQRKRTKLFEILEDDAGLGKDDIAPRIKELNGQIAEKELYIQELRIKAASKPIDFTEAVIEDWVKLYDDLFNDETFFAKKALIQSLVVSVKIDERYAYLTYIPAFWNDKDIVDLGGDSKNGGSGKDPEPPLSPTPLGGQKFAPSNIGSLRLTPDYFLRMSRKKSGYWSNSTENVKERWSIRWSTRSWTTRHPPRRFERTL